MTAPATDTYLTARQVADGAGLPVGTVWWLAHRDRWDRTRTRPIRYRYADVIKTFGRAADTASPAA
jgi:hypothetical protein